MGRGKVRIGYGVLGLLLTAALWLPSGLPAQAEEVAGYHEYTVKEDEVIDHWYGISKGTYLREGIVGLKDAGRGKVNVSGTTFAHSVCDKVKVAVYLDESSDGGSSFGTIGTYHFVEENATSCHGSKINISVTSGWKYRARGSHTVNEGGKTESTTTLTATLRAS